MVANQYAKALFEITQESKTTKDVKEQLVVLTEAFDANEKVYKLLETPTLSRKQKEDVISKISAKCNKDLVSLLKLLTRNNRINELKNITNLFVEYTLESENSINVRIESKKALNKSEQDLIKKKIETMFGKKAVIEEVVKENLVGGLVIEAGGKIIDISLDSQLNKLKNYL